MSSVISEAPIPFKAIAGGYLIGPAVFVAINGRDYLHMLATYRHKPVTCTGLEMQYGDPEVTVDGLGVLDEPGVYLHGEGSMSSHQEQSDDPALSAYRARVNELKSMESLEPEQQAELNWLKGLLDNETFRGRSTGFVDEKERCRQRVTHNIRKAINELIAHPDTADIGLHFQEFVSTGFECCYTGDQEWEL